MKSKLLKPSMLGKTYKSYVDFGIFILYFIIVFCKNFVFLQLINVCTTNYKPLFVSKKELFEFYSLLND